MAEGVRFEVSWETAETIRLSASGTLKTWEQGEELVRQVQDVRDRFGVDVIVVDLNEVEEFAPLPQSMLKVLLDNPPVGGPRIVVEGPPA
jgi:hypothetical protein